MKDYLGSPWLKNQFDNHLINLHLWLRDGYRLTVVQRRKLQEIMELAEERDDGQEDQD